ncbi:3-oxoacyl-ACP reductase [Rhodococcus sp. 06-1059B-a]|nr:SDR family NAD(P)-dependent oxidoreductase [Rhodococcus sp. 06-1059B-a]OZD70918.1 3-oxoacyl-ACP reductase [Rhodococcus sp. 06-1059B-a]
MAIAWASYPYAEHVVVVTGGGSGIGRAVAVAFLEQGATVCVLGRSDATLRETVAGWGDRASAWVVDVTQRDEVDRVVANIVARHGRIDVVVNNAGLSEPTVIDDFDHSAWDRMRAVNLDALIHVARATVPHLERSGGNLIAMSSVAGLGGDWGQFAYNATKGGVNTLVQSLALDLDLGRRGIRVNAIALDRVGEPEDIARVALFLASPDAAYMTGVIVPVDGGTTASVGTPRPPA